MIRMDKSTGQKGLCFFLQYSNVHKFQILILQKQYFSTKQIQNICQIIKFDNYKHLKCMS